MKTTTRRIKRDGTGQATLCASSQEAKNLTAQLKRIARGGFWRVSPMRMRIAPGRGFASPRTWPAWVWKVGP